MMNLTTTLDDEMMTTLDGEMMTTLDDESDDHTR